MEEVVIILCCIVFGFLFGYILAIVENLLKSKNEPKLSRKEQEWVEQCFEDIERLQVEIRKKLG